MAVKIRLSRAGAKKTPHYRVIVADARSPRDGRFLERVGTYNPLLPRDHPDRVKLKLDRIKYWLEKGAQPSGRVAKFLGSADVIPMPKHENPIKAKPKAKAQARLDELAHAKTQDSSEASGSDVAEETGSAAGESSGDDKVSAETVDETEANKKNETEESEIDEATEADTSVAEPTNETEEPDASGITDKDAGSVEPTDESKADEVRKSEKPEVEK